MPDVPNVIQVRAGQVWRDLDPRSPHQVRVLSTQHDRRGEPTVMIARPTKFTVVKLRAFLKRFTLIREPE